MTGELQDGRDLVYVTGNGYRTTNDLTTSAVLTAGTSPAFGSWVEITRAQQDLWVLGTFLGRNTTPTADIDWMEVELGMGESGSEYTIWQAKTHSIDWSSSAGINQYRVEWMRRFIRLTGGQRIAARLASSTSSHDMQFALSYVYDIDLKVMR